ncbi:hypothetical protein [Thermomonas paludicola]|uniref:hypothetical protein n=1 Tax=Thermomonas paludicola TaxID=2884874 RepID=UPI002114F370|nr:hypothetical protein [Thermomonas paludicola]
MTLDAEDFELELPQTWPAAVRVLVEENREDLIAYQRERGRIDRLGCTEVRVRMDPPINPHRAGYDTVLARTEALLSGHRLVGYHCTRLTRAEVCRVRRDGLRTLSPELMRERLESLVDDREISAAQCRFFLDHPILHTHLSNRHGTRTGLVWLCPNRSTLREPTGVYRLFRSWGGEALYAGFEDDPSVVAVLTALGRPAIVKCAVPLPVDDLHGCRAAHLLSNAVSEQIEHPEPSPTFDWSVRRDLAPSEVLDIITIDDPRFEALTGYRAWTPEHRIG